MNEFPKRYKCTFMTDGSKYIIVEFKSETSGVVVESKNSLHEVGHTSDRWMPCTDPAIWAEVSS